MKVSPKIVIVEDEAIIARDVSMQLVDSGFAVAGTAGSAKDAFKLIEDTQPDLILMDIRIKGEMDGVDAAHIVRNRYSLPVIYLTAHADDATLERAQLTEPFGYLVKPLGNTNVKAIVTMALRKHSVERELENHRKMLSTILQGLPDAVLVADGSGEILFANQAAERLTGWGQQEAAGKHLLEVVPLEDETGRLLSSELLNRAMADTMPMRIPKGATLTTKDRTSIEIAGQFSVSAVGNRTAGIFISLQDATLQTREEQRLGLEQQLFVAGELARGVGNEFFGLFDLISDCSTELAEGEENSNVQLMQRASRIGRSLAVQLMDFREAHGPAQAINVHQQISSSRFLLERLCGNAIELILDVNDQTGSVLSTGTQLEQMLVHLTMHGKQRIDGSGTITIIVDAHNQVVSATRTRLFVRIAFHSQRSAGTERMGELGTIAPPAVDQTEMSLPIARAIATASGGFTRVSEFVDGVLVEVFLPRHESINSTEVTSDARRVVMTVGMPEHYVPVLQKAVGTGAFLLEAANLREAGLISELFPDDIDLVLVSDAEGLQRRNTTRDRIQARRPDAVFLPVVLASDDGHNADMEPVELSRRIETIFNQKSKPAVSSR